MIIRHAMLIGYALLSLPVQAEDCALPDTIEVVREGNPADQIDVEALTWLAGHWTGTGPDGGYIQETWSLPHDGTMLGTFRWDRVEAPTLLEFITLSAPTGVPAMRLRHFNDDMIAWEDREDMVTFRLVRQTECALHFKGLTITRDGRDRMVISVRFSESGIGHFRFEKVSDQ